MLFNCSANVMCMLFFVQLIFLLSSQRSAQTVAT